MSRLGFTVAKNEKSVNTEAKSLGKTWNASLPMFDSPWKRKAAPVSPCVKSTFNGSGRPIRFNISKVTRPGAKRRKEKQKETSLVPRKTHKHRLT